MQYLLIGILMFPSALLAQGLDATLTELARELASLQKEVQAVSESTQQYVKYTTGFGNVRVTAPEAGVYAGAAATADLIRKLPAGENLRVVDKAGDWYAVEMSKQVGEMKGGWVNAADVVPFGTAMTEPSATPAEKAYDLVLEKVRRLKVKYDDNPYVRITGFNIDISLPPALSIGFEFK